MITKNKTFKKRVDNHRIEIMGIRIKIRIRIMARSHDHKLISIPPDASLVKSAKCMMGHMVRGVGWVVHVGVGDEINGGSHENKCKMTNTL